MTRFNRTGSIALAVATFVVAPMPLLAAEGEGGGFFDINPGLSIWATVVFLVLLGILWKYAWGPLLEQVDAREGRIQGALDESAEARDEARRLLEEHRAQLADARRQANELVAEGKSAGQRLRAEIEEKARTEAQVILESARHEIAREKDQAIAELRRESVDLALAAAGRLLGEKLEAPADRALVVDYIERISEGAEA
ncbi:MAG: F0F1 ATP synthase subunit B [Longimicrobiales bacterium]|nr:F0F1 ATP synthase subunit B [Longimicrobiales bacterium]